MEKQLFQSMKKVLQQYAYKEYEKLQQSVTIELVSVKQQNGNSIGVITCILCKCSVKISMKRVVAASGSKKYWITSNFSKHLKEYHGFKKEVNYKKHTEIDAIFHTIFIIQRPSIACSGKRSNVKRLKTTKKLEKNIATEVSVPSSPSTEV